MNSLIVGFGEIGQAVYELINKSDSTLTYDIKDNDYPHHTVDILHICFPYSEDFVPEVMKYIKHFKPVHICIWSTVPIGTTKQVKGAIHSPVEGRHPKLYQSLKNMRRWVGFNDDSEATFFKQYFKDLYLAPRMVSSSDFTEALKLLSTTEYGINIEFARYKQKVAKGIGMDYRLTKKWNRDYNHLYHNLGMDWAQKYILDYPEGPKGGHCVTPNARLLHEQFPDELTKIVGEL